MNSCKRLAFDALLRQRPSNISLNELARTLFMLSNSIIPPFLYRYRSCGKEHSFSDIENDTLTLSPACSFNDAEDASIHGKSKITDIAMRDFSGKQTTLQKLGELRRSEDGASPRAKNKYLNKFENELAEMSDADFTKRFEQLLAEDQIEESTDNLTEKLRKGTMAACLCENGQSEYMWKSYAGNSTGFMLEYSSLSLLGIGAEYKQRPLILPVVYTDNLPNTSILPYLLFFSENLSDALGEEIVSGEIQAQLAICHLYKKLSFESEEEWRVLIDKTRGEEDSERIYRSIRSSRIVAGRRMDPADKKRLIALASEKKIPVYCQDHPFDPL